jgi:hypothetical protein
MSLITVPYQDNGCDCGVFVCRYAYNLYMMRHLKFTYEDYEERPPFTSKITRSPAFKFNMSDIDRIRKDISALIDNLSNLYLPQMQKQVKAAREAKRIAKQKDLSKNVKDDSDKSCCKGEEGEAGDSVEKEGNRREIMPSSFEEKENISQEFSSQNIVFDAAPEKTSTSIHETSSEEVLTLSLSSTHIESLPDESTSNDTMEEENIVEDMIVSETL